MNNSNASLPKYQFKLFSFSAGFPKYYYKSSINRSIRSDFHQFPLQSTTVDRRPSTEEYGETLPRVVPSTTVRPVRPVAKWKNIENAEQYFTSTIAFLTYSQSLEGVILRNKVRSLRVCKTLPENDALKKDKNSKNTALSDKKITSGVFLSACGFFFLLHVLPCRCRCTNFLIYSAVIFPFKPGSIAR